MSRNAHAWFLIGMIMSFMIVLSVWFTALALGQLWASEWGILVPIADTLIFAAAFWAWRRRWKRLRRAAPDSHELRCRWFNQAAFAAPAPNTFGNNGRNNLRGPRLVDLDFSLGKNFIIPKWERAALQLRFDALNFLNHPSFANPNAGIDPANSNNPAVGRITSTTMGGRQLQLGARFSF